MGKGTERTTHSSTRSDRRTLLWTIGSILALALLIYGTAALSSPRGSDDKAARQTPAETSEGGSAAEASERLYNQAVEAQRSGETTRALELANKAVEADSSNARAMRLVVDLSGATGSVPTGSADSDAGSVPAGDESSPTTAPVAADVPTQPRVAKIETLLPKSVSGYSLGILQVVKTDAVRSAEPARGSADSRAIVRALLSVHDRESEKAARQWVDTMWKRVYPKSISRVTIAGGPGLFGTDGARLAWIGFARGQYAFEVLVTVPQDPSKAKAIALKLAEAFPVRR